MADPAAGERFYSEFLGLAVTQRACPGAMFFTAGGFRTVQGDLLLRAVQNYALEVSSFWNRVTSNLISSQPSIAPSDSGAPRPDQTIHVRPASRKGSFSPPVVVATIAKRDAIRRPRDAGAAFWRRRVCFRPRQGGFLEHSGFVAGGSFVDHWT